ncbi:inositol monophosphatase family protein [Aspergillus clavatus NRRL 1]|uniref:Inositol monophosphatase family protein n=1 Tax=Aspergillus clavatus (strain ATCC 1007 / CBS 513.65 / DSM 816 / NCTC 3887 / NRRL 1 / QM 1276 / 107) TaxID=344612 RepID=A1CSL5_ASPCL|nr:inositol monophosphatase family protein [Aspergillus clavatus NRRL 1]EAW06302.1 inositol monophosphatase family protein [Aspergillus clavatus NRRL 1]
MTQTYSTELRTASLAVQRACLITKTVLAAHDKGSTAKDDASPVTIADFAAQAVLIAALRRRFPADAFIGEEAAATLRADRALADRVWELVRASESESESESKTLASVEEMLDVIDVGVDAEAEAETEAESGSGRRRRRRRTWIMDPIDGTATFIRGQQYAVSVALVEDGEQVVGVVGCPNVVFGGTTVREDEVDRDGCGMMLSAVKGQGTSMRPLARTGLLLPAEPLPLPLHAKGTGNTDVDSGGLRFAESMASPFISASKHLAVRGRLGISEERVTDLWSMQIKYAALALGACDVMIRIPKEREFHPYVWDHAGGMLVYEEAGGKITDLRGKRFDFGRGRKLSENVGLVAAPPEIHSRVLDIAREVFDAV